MESVNLKPLADRVVVQPLESEEVTAGGIVLPDTAKEKPQKGKILAVGPGRKDDEGNFVPMEVEVDDVVLFAKYAGTELELEEDLEVLILKESDILAVIEE
jgi:chaperonin GroES